MIQTGFTNTDVAEGTMSQYPAVPLRQAPVPRVRQELCPRHRPDFDLKLNGFRKDFDKAVLAFLAFQDDVTDASKETYARSLKQFKIWFEREEIDFLTRADILAYKDYLRGHLKPLTMASYLAAVKSFFGWASVTGQYPDVTYKVKASRRSGQDSYEKVELTDQQTLDLLMQLKTATQDKQKLDRQVLSDKRDYAIVRMMLKTGARMIGLSRADVRDWSQKGGKVVLRLQEKGHKGKDEPKYPDPRTVKAVNKYLLARRAIGGVTESDPLFMSHGNRNLHGRLTTHTISRMVKRNLRQIGIDDPRITAHSLRHTAITYVLLGGGTPQEAQVLAGHADVNTTMRYAHNIDREENPPERYIDAYMSKIEEAIDQATEA